MGMLMPLPGSHSQAIQLEVKLKLLDEVKLKVKDLAYISLICFIRFGVFVSDVSFGY